MFKRYFKYAVRYKSLLIIVVLLELMITVVEISVPYNLGRVILLLESGMVTSENLFTYMIYIASAFFIWDVCGAMSAHYLAKVNKTVENDIKLDVMKVVMGSDYEVIEQEREGKVITRILKDTEKLEDTFLNFFNLIFTVFHVFVLLVMMFVVNKFLVAVVFALFAIIAVFQRKSSKGLKDNYKNYKEAEEGSVVRVKSYLTGLLNIKAFSLQSQCLDELRNDNDKVRDLFVKAKTKEGVVRNFNFFFVSLLRVSAIFAGGFLYLGDLITIGAIFTSYSYAFKLSNNLKTVIDYDIVLNEISVSLHRVFDMIDEYSDRQKDGGILVDRIESIRFDDVSFDYSGNIVLRNLSFNASKNDVFKIQGVNGSGKSTLIKLIHGFYHTDGILINNESTSNINRQSIIDKISYVPQDIFLMQGTIMENICGFDKANESKVYEICKAMGIHDRIKDLDAGYDTVVTDRNTNLSGGEKQIISIARALIKDSDVIIMDEFNSALDKDMEDGIIRKIRPFLNEKIVFMISHKELRGIEITSVVNLDRG